MTEKTYPLWKKVKCGTCGRAMPFKDRIIRGRPYRYFGCPHSQAQIGESGCTKEYIREDVLNGVVWEAIQVLLASADEYQSRRADLIRKAERLEADIAELEAKLHETELVQDDGVQEALETLDKYSGATELDQKIVDALIEKVLVYDSSHVEICWKFSDEVL
ncbi:MAG: recombinase zinc beta ribbon domain-containing protein [Lachnospiraceae bacterium]|nr:recombinase zinc beta ribbon domain-containing protein [Lachnospiraceae bacterium]